ncbi:hypothetical protein M5K25_002071 [Dendrobium thyrsiflorum]|uniref:Uncharacterized protein n=1 Tax=Dendrobium thyrsiflorum TaxID=117978 RepID=A0ABD0VSH7_DENTH
MEKIIFLVFLQVKISQASPSKQKIHSALDWQLTRIHNSTRALWDIRPAGFLGLDLLQHINSFQNMSKNDMATPMEEYFECAKNSDEGYELIQADKSNGGNAFAFNIEGKESSLSSLVLCYLIATQAFAPHFRVKYCELTLTLPRSKSPPWIMKSLITRTPPSYPTVSRNGPGTIRKTLDLLVGQINNISQQLRESQADFAEFRRTTTDSIFPFVPSLEEVSLVALEGHCCLWSFESFLMQIAKRSKDFTEVPLKSYLNNDKYPTGRITQQLLIQLKMNHDNAVVVCGFHVIPEGGYDSGGYGKVGGLEVEEVERKLLQLGELASATQIILCFRAITFALGQIAILKIRWLVPAVIASLKHSDGISALQIFDDLRLTVRALEAKLP